MRPQTVFPKCVPSESAVSKPRPAEAVRVVRVSGVADDMNVLLPVVAGAVQAGFPSPAEDYVEGSLDLNAHLIRHPAATFIVRVEGESMTGAGIYPGDLLVVDRSVEPADGHVVIAAVAGELTVKRLKGRRGAWRLVAEHPDFPAIHLNGDEEDGGETSAIWGVVTSSVRRLIK